MRNGECGTVSDGHSSFNIQHSSSGLSKLASRKRKALVARRVMLRDKTDYAEGQRHASILVRLQPDPQAVFAFGVRTAGIHAQGGASCARFVELDAVCGHAVLPAGPSPVASRDLRR